MARTTFHLVLALLLVFSMVLCPYECAAHPKTGSGHATAEAPQRPHCDCCPAGEPETPRDDSDAPRPQPQRSCSCTCICNGAILKSSDGRDADAAVPVTGLVPVVLLSDATAWQVPLRRKANVECPPIAPSGRQVRVLICSFLL